MTSGFGTPVRARDGRQIGTIDRLILDPARNEVKAAVLRRGLLPRRDVEVPLALLRRSRVGDLSVDLSPGEVDRLPPFHEAAYTNLPSGYIPPSGYPGENFYWPKSAQERAPAPRGTVSRHDLERAAIGRGSLVMGRDGKSVGRVQEVRFDSESGHLDALIIRVEPPSQKDWELTSLLIAGLGDGVVYLKVDAGQLMT